jgi:2-polyprenyl-6-methoxyphenol hydroxylase-like FAD-dependent oxidoreductase
VSFDVAVVGYGPTGMVLAALLGQAGHRVAVIERYPGLYNLPRAATFDDETMRLLQKLGIADTVGRSTRTQGTYDWCNAAGEVLISNRFAEVGACGWPEFNMMFQPELERQLDALCRSVPGIEIFAGHRLTAVTETDDEVTVSAVGPHGEESTFTAAYAVGCDGGNSTVRAQLGVGMDDYGFQEPWLVCDFELLHSVDLPMAMQYGDPEQPTSIVSLGPRHHRFSFMLEDAPGSAGQIADQAVWVRVARWLTPADARLIRTATYTFRSTVARRWRQGRIFLAGDAAHQMPPFLGQGMCSGLRDAHNLGWKLPEVLAGRAEDSLLETYSAERGPHVRTITERAVELGRVQTVRDPVEARQRDDAFRYRRAVGEQPDAFRFPPYRAGLFSRTATSGSVRGELFPQGFVAVPGGTQQLRFDDATAKGWWVVVAEAGLLPAERPPGVGSRPAPDPEPIVLSPCSLAPCSGHRHLDDVEGTYANWFREHACAAIVVRPDWRVYGAASSAADLAALLGEVFTGPACPLALYRTASAT